MYDERNSSLRRSKISVSSGAATANVFECLFMIFYEYSHITSVASKSHVDTSVAFLLLQSYKRSWELVAHGVYFL